MIEHKFMKHLPVPDVSRFSTDRLHDMLMQQKTINAMFFGIGKLTEDEKQHWTMMMKIAMDDEMAELMSNIHWKWWRKQKKSVDVLELKYEIIDMLHFILSLMLIWDMSAEEVHGMYLAKASENVRRQKEGY